MLLKNAKMKVESLKIYETNQVPSSNEEGILSTPNPTASLPLKLLKDLVSLQKNHDALKVLNNMSIAALHLACMLQGTANREDRLVINLLIT